MKKVLLATTILALSAPLALAEVTVGGTGRMGVTYTEGAVNELAFTSRIRIIFTASGETDGGLSFGGTIRADNSGGGNAGTDGNVFISGAFGKLTMGDVDGAAELAVGDVDGVGLTGLGDLNEATYLSNTAAIDRSAMRYEYSTGAFTFAFSADNPGTDAAGVKEDTYAIGVRYAADGYAVGLGYETETLGGVDVDHIILGGSATFSNITVKAVYGRASVGAVDLDQYQLSATYSMDALGLTAYYANNEITNVEATGIGASYDLGGGASVVGGIVNAKPAIGGGASTTLADVGVSFSF